MNLKDFVYGLFILIIPLILILLLHRLYIANKCHNNKECIKKKMLIDIDSVTNKLVTNLNFIRNSKVDTNNSNNSNNSNINNNTINNEEGIEEFFGGLSDWVYDKAFSPTDNASPTNNLHPPQDSIMAANNDNNNIVPQLNNSIIDNKQDASNTELLNSINNKNNTIKNIKNQKVTSSNTISDINNTLKAEISKTKDNIQKFTPEIITDENILKQQVDPPIPANSYENKKNEIKKNSSPILKQKTEIIKPKASSLFGECNFYSDKCPTGHSDFGTIGLTGLDKNVMLSCGNVENTKPATAIAKIKSNSLDEIIIVDKGHGFNPTKLPKVTVVGGKGNGALCEAVVDDNGFLSVIKIIHPGNFYTETPNIIIEPPLMNSSCHFCCK